MRLASWWYCRSVWRPLIVAEVQFLITFTIHNMWVHSWATAFICSIVIVKDYVQAVWDHSLHLLTDPGAVWVEDKIVWCWELNGRTDIAIVAAAVLDFGVLVEFTIWYCILDLVKYSWVLVIPEDRPLFKVFRAIRFLPNTILSWRPDAGVRRVQHCTVIQLDIRAKITTQVLFNAAREVIVSVFVGLGDGAADKSRGTRFGFGQTEKSFRPRNCTSCCGNTG